MPKYINLQQLGRIREVENIEIPTVPDGTEHFSFYAITQIGNIQFTFIYVEGIWRLTSKLGESGELRTYTLIPRLLLNPLAEDYSLFFYTLKDTLLPGDINQISMELVEW